MSIDTINSVLREGKQYSVEDVAKETGFSKSHVNSCLLTLCKGMVIEREKVVIGKTKKDTDKAVFKYKTKQKDLPI